MSTNKDIARSASVIGFFTFCSRLLGFARDVVIARFFGTYVYAQAFVVAFRIPNLFRDMVAEGASNAVLVPVFSEYSAQRSKEEFWHLANCVLNVFIIVLSVITILGVTFAPLLVRIIAPGFAGDPEKLRETIRLTRIIYPYILLVSLTAYCMGILNSLKHFALPAFAPCLLNISIILFAMLFGEGVLGLALGVLVGGLLQLAVQIPVLYKKGFRYRWIFDARHPALRQIGRLMLPRMLSSCVYQLNVFVDTILSSFSNIAGAGAVAALYFANRILQFPLGIFGAAIASAWRVWRLPFEGSPAPASPSSAMNVERIFHGSLTEDDSYSMILLTIACASSRDRTVNLPIPSATRFPELKITKSSSVA
mgnify:CR=1 FL=1